MAALATAELTSMIAGAVAVIPLPCGRLEMGLWPCGRLDTMLAGPVAVLSEIALDRNEALLGRRAFAC